MTPDPIMDGVIEGLGVYTYCSNNPVNYTDPTGLEDVKEDVKAEESPGYHGKERSEFMNKKDVEKKCVSNKGIEFIKEYESYKPKIYDAGDDKKTIGYGHVLTKEEIDAGTYDDGISKDEATELLKKNLEWFEDGINRNFKGPDKNGRDLTQNEFDALVILSFNAGRSGLVDSTLFEIVQENKDFTAESIKKLIISNWKQKKWISVKGKQMNGLIRRRNDELQMFFNSDYKVDRKLELKL